MPFFVAEKFSDMVHWKKKGDMVSMMGSYFDTEHIRLMPAVGKAGADVLFDELFRVGQSLGQATADTARDTFLYINGKGKIWFHFFPADPLRRLIWRDQFMAYCLDTYSPEDLFLAKIPCVDRHVVRFCQEMYFETFDCMRSFLKAPDLQLFGCFLYEDCPGEPAFFELFGAEKEEALLLER